MIGVYPFLDNRSPYLGVKNRSYVILTLRADITKTLTHTGFPVFLGNTLQASLNKMAGSRRKNFESEHFLPIPGGVSLIWMILARINYPAGKRMMKSSNENNLER